MNQTTEPVVESEVVSPSEIDPTIQAIMEASKAPAEPPKVRVLLHNDDVTPYNTVVEVLVQAFGYDHEAARRLMYRVHNSKAPGEVAILPEPEADTKIEHAKAMAGTYPLQFSKEPV